MHFSLLFFEHKYLTYNDRLTSEISDTYSHHCDLVNYIYIFSNKKTYIYMSFYLIESRKIV